MVMQTQKRFYVLLFALLVMLSACIPMKVIPPNPANPIYSVAVLPAYNASNDIDGPQMVREMLQERLPRWHYSAKPLAEVDQILRDQMGVTLGEQLEPSLISAQKVGATLGVDGLVYVYILNFDDKTTGIYNVKKVRAGLKIVDVKSGRTMWAMGQGVKGEIISGGLLGKGVALAANVMDKREGLDEFKTIQGIQDIPNLADWKLIYHREESMQNALIMSVGGKVVGKAMKAHLKFESGEMLDMVMANMLAGPGGPGAGVAYASAVPNIPMPKFEMPGAGFVHFARLGKRDFTSDLVMTFTSAKEGRDIVVNGKLAQRGEDFRSEIDLSSMVKEQAKGPSTGLWHSASILKTGEKRFYAVYPDMKKYVEREATEADGAVPRVEKLKVGEEVVDGHKTDKYRVTITSDSVTSTGFYWEAKDLGGFVVKVLFENKDGKGVLEFKNIRLATPPASLFQIPQDYVRAASFMELMGAAPVQDNGDAQGRKK